MNYFDDDFNYFNDYNYIQGQPLTEKELSNLNYLDRKWWLFIYL